MTAVVVAYPSANDLIESLREKEPDRVALIASQIDQSFPDLDGSMHPEMALIHQLESCTQADTSDRMAATTQCQGAIDAARKAIGQGVPDSQMGEVIAAKLTLANTLYCRQKWTEAQAEGQTFDLTTCEQRIIALADKG